MIPLTAALDLGADRTRMKNPSEVERQNTTARRLLERLFDERSPEFNELQLLADEVGMGKTFVALAMAYSVLEAQRDRGVLGDCYRKILVLVPRNEQLFEKWQREVGEIVKRCAEPAHRAAAQALFFATPVTRPDELVGALLGDGPPVVVAKVSALDAGLTNRELKQRVTLAALFRHFGRSLPLDTREILLKGASESWPSDVRDLGVLSSDELARLPLGPELIQRAVERAASGALRAQREHLLELCREFGAPRVRHRQEGFAEVQQLTARFYRDAIWTLLDRSLPLVIVDEAHHWKNRNNGFEAFRERLAGRTRRALLMTATPFQLEPAEILSLLGISEHLELPEARRNALTAARLQGVKPALERAQRESQRFSSEWTALGQRLASAALRDAWSGLSLTRQQLLKLARARGSLDELAVERLVRAARAEVPPELSDFVSRALRLYAVNQELSAKLGRFVVRHRRSVRHRIVRAGCEIELDSSLVKQRPDAHVLHGAPGLDVRGDDELPFYLLMRATSELNSRRTADLGCDLTGCYSTFFGSAAGRSLSREGNTYVELLKEMVGGEEADARHPKVERVVREAVERWERGEKTLVFTFRVNTAKRVHALIEREIQTRLEARRKEAFGGTDGLDRLRQRLNTKTESLYALMLDRVLWSLLWAPPGDETPPFGSTDLRPNQEAYRVVAHAALSFGQDVLDRPDRVFLNRAVEFALARRLVAKTAAGSRLRDVLTRMADPSWIAQAYGGIRLEHDGDGGGLADERGVLSTYEHRREPPESEVDALAKELIARGQRGVVRRAFDGPSFWLGADPGRELLPREDQAADVEVDRSDQRFLHVHLRALTWDGERLDFRSRALALRAMRKILLRESLLVRLLPAHEERETEDWASLLVQQFTKPAAGRRESLLRLVGVFLEDLAAASGSIDDPRTARGSLYETTRSREAIAALVIGDTSAETRSRRLQGFNTPLSPEVLICGQIAQEGIDLHRHCSHVVHYDLAWNPATIEQRTGRIDRIGSRTQRLRQLSGPDSTRNGESSDERLEISAPYLAGTYDERMFEELRIRAQTLEVLLGGDLAASGGDAAAKLALQPEPDDAPPAEPEGEPRASGIVPLPDCLVEDLRVDLALWNPA